ncbi:MAG: site-specific integrase [Prevotella sp.]|nr:site-specific integrase [Prevotella sp.]
MATIKLRFRPSSVPEAEGTLYYQVIHKRKVKWISTEHHIYADEWDENTETIVVAARSERKGALALMQCKIDWALKRWQTILDRLERSYKDYTVEELCETFSKEQTYKTVFVFLQEQVTKKEQMKRQGTARTYGNAYRRFKAFREDVDLTFDELTSDMIECYEAWLIDKRLKQNSIRCYLRTLNTLLCKAVEEGLLNNTNLFSHVRLSYVKTTKRAISEKELKVIANLELPENSTMAFARDIFMFSFYMRGMPFVDIAYLRKTDLKNGMCTYCRKKTNQCLMVEWEKAQQKILDRYAHQMENKSYLLPIIKEEDGTEYKQYQRMQININRALKKIGEMAELKMPLTTYVARHTWASVARDMNIPIAVISEGMGHNSIKTTQVYLNSIDISRINEANKRIIKRIGG